MKFCSKIKLNEQHCKCKMFNSVLDGFLKMENFKRSDQTYNHDWEKSGGKQLTFKCSESHNTECTEQRRNKENTKWKSREGPLVECVKYECHAKFCVVSTEQQIGSTGFVRRRHLSTWMRNFVYKKKLQRHIKTVKRNYHSKKDKNG